jgi:endonuclease YncB( thermonuclease family)
MARPLRFDRGTRWRAQERRRRWGWLRWVVPLLLIALVWHGWNRPDVRAAIGLPMPAPEVVDARFDLCSERGHAPTCVVDGDTFRIGTRRIRVAGIDAPEVHGACPAESAAAVRATLALRDWLSAGPFRLDPVDVVPRDKYGRELQQPRRGGDELSEHMIGESHARPYGSGQRQPWC